MAITTKEYREGIAKQFVAALEEKQLDWKKDWTTTAGARPENAVLHSSYKGINQFHLMMTAMAEGYQDPRWATFKQIQDKGWHLQKGSKGVKVEYWFPYDMQKQKSVTWEEYRDRRNAPDADELVLRAKYFTVFNGDRIDGIPELPVREPVEVNQDELVQMLSKNMGVEIINDGGDRAFYRPSEDKIHLPKPEQFHSEYSYNATALHELAHSTGAKHRLARDLGHGFGTDEYAYEELVAEISSSFMGANLRTEPDEFHMKNHKAYVQSWISQIKEKPETLISAIRDAERASDYMECHAELIPAAELDKTLQSTCSVSENEIMTEKMESREKIELLDIHAVYESLKGQSYCNVTNGRTNYVSDLSSLEKLTKKEAESALDKGIRIGYVGDHEMYHGSHKGEREFHAITKKASLDELFKNYEEVCIDPVYYLTSVSPAELKTKLLENEPKLTPELRKKLQDLEAGGHHFLIGKDGKVSVPKEAKRQLSPEELEDVTGYIKDARSQQSQRKEPAVKAPELEA